MGRGVLLACQSFSFFSASVISSFLPKIEGGGGVGPSTRSATGNIQITCQILLCKFMRVLLIQNSAAGPEKSNHCLGISRDRG